MMRMMTVAAMAARPVDGAAMTAPVTADKEDTMKALMMLAALALSAAPALAQPAMVGKTAKGKALVDAKGMSLYTFDKDSTGKSACAGDCAAKWPPLAAMAGAKAEAGSAPIARADGSAQWSHDGRPLYTWVGDKKPGETTGDGMKGVWHLARP